MLLLILIADLVIYSIRYVPYANWFAGLIPFALAFSNWVIFIYLFRLNPIFIFKLSLVFLLLTFISTALGINQISMFTGIVVFGMISTVVIQKILEVRKADA